jgi:hypothetical protein
MILNKGDKVICINSSGAAHLISMNGIYTVEDAFKVNDTHTNVILAEVPSYSFRAEGRLKLHRRHKIDDILKDI